MLRSPFDYRGNVLGTVESIDRALSCKSGINVIGMGARSTTDYLFGSEMDLPIGGQRLGQSCNANTTGPKRFRPSYYDPELPVCSECPEVDPTDPCVYNTYSKSKPCNYGFARNTNNYRSPYDGNRFAQYRWG